MFQMYSQFSAYFLFLFLVASPVASATAVAPALDTAEVAEREAHEIEVENHDKEAGDDDEGKEAARGVDALCFYICFSGCVNRGGDTYGCGIYCNARCQT